MKKLFVSLGLAVAGTASLHAAYAPDSPTDKSKMWSLSGTLRGFYDDNYNTTAQKEGSGGFEVSPSFSLNMPLQQTEIGLRYTYGLYYYQDRENKGANPIDQTHQVDLWLDHAFTPRWEARLEDTLVVAKDPSLTASGTATPYRTDGDYLANTMSLSVHTDWTRQFSTEMISQTSIYNYDNSGGNSAAPYNNPSLAGSLNRVEWNIGPKLQWAFSPTTVGFIRPAFGLVNYTGDEPIGQNPTTKGPYMSDYLNNRSYSASVGVQHDFLDNLKGMVSVGAQYTDYYNNSQTSWGPIADSSLIYTYAAGSYAQMGVTVSRNAVDQTGAVNSNGQVTLDQESTVVYASINHPLTSKLMGTLLGHYQYSTYNQGTFDSQDSQFYNLGANLSYAFNRHFSADLGYNFDWYTTPVPNQDYTRNRVYVGVTATY
jgi:hypothetical protein